jgi:ABC-type phosphate transport system substrate-binding protein
MRKSLFVVQVALLSLLVAAGAFAGKESSEGGGAFAGNYAMGGSTTVEPIIVSTIEAFAKKYPAAKISYDAQGSSVGVTGEIRNWKEAGGPDKKIVVVNRDEASGTRAAFSYLVLDKHFGKGNGKFIADAITTESNGDMVTKVGQTPDTIGYVRLHKQGKEHGRQDHLRLRKRSLRGQRAHQRLPGFTVPVCGLEGQD